MRRPTPKHLVLGLLLYPSWLALMGVHEFGHVLHAWFSGGRVLTSHFGLFEFSQTELSYDPHPQFVAWGGPIWGCAIPLMLYAVGVAMRLRLRAFLCFFSGLCLIVNGAYIALGRDNACYCSSMPVIIIGCRLSWNKAYLFIDIQFWVG